MKISVGAAPSHWGEEKLESFYQELAQSPVDYVYLGETACSERSCFSPDFIGKLSDALTQAGKTVYASSLTLVRDEEQYRRFGEIAKRVGRIEINSPAFLGLAKHYPAVTGIFLNVYNSTAVNVLSKYAVERIVLPCELSLQSVSSIAKKHNGAIELVVHGYLPIAISASCQTKRAHHRNGDECGKLCRRYPEGMVLEADEMPMFRIEGPQTLSASTYCLVEYLPQLVKAGLETIRILPQWNHTGRIVSIYRDVLENRMNCTDAVEELKAVSLKQFCNGWFSGKAGWVYESPNILPKIEEKRSQASKKRVKQQNSVIINENKNKNFTQEKHFPILSVSSITYELNKLVEIMNKDPQFISQIADMKDTVIVIHATDTLREFIIELNCRQVRIRPYKGERYDTKIDTTEEIILAVFSGRMDADAAFFAGKFRIHGSVLTAFRVKNKFLSLLQKHLAHKLEITDKLISQS